MKRESELCTVICKSLQWGHKISDAGQITHGTLPHDIYGIYNNKPIYIEAKFLREPMSFNLQRIEDQQLETLMEIKSLCPESYCWILLGVVFGRGDIRVFKFDDLDEIKRRRDNKLNYLKKELVTLPHYKVRKGQIDFNNLYYN